MQLKIFKLISLAFMLGSLPMFTSCELDNYDAPDGKITGRILDKETGELIQSDIMNGTTIKLLEHGYDPVTPQYLRVKNDGTYVNSLLFSNTYTVQPDQRNFVQIEPQDIKIGKNTTLDFEVQPYIRIKDMEITKDGNYIIATFCLQQTTDDPISEIGLYAHIEPNVGEPLYQVAVKKSLKRQVSESETFKLVINAARHSAFIKAGNSYFFRVGACSSIGGAKFNYAPAQRIAIDEILPETEPEGIALDKCETVDGWEGPDAKLDSDNPQEGEHSVKFHAGGGFVIQKEYKSSVDTKVGLEYGVLQFDLYISDVSVFNWNFPGQIELTSGGTPDSQELHWNFTSERRLANGWNRVVLPLSAGEASGGNINLTAVNFFRIYHLDVGGPVDLKIDNIKFYEEY